MNNNISCLQVTYLGRLKCMDILKLLLVLKLCTYGGSRRDPVAYLKVELNCPTRQKRCKLVVI